MSENVTYDANGEKAQLAQPQAFGQPQQYGSAPGGPAGNWMQRPTEQYPGCPPGLEYLTQLDQVLVHQQVELFEALTNIETNNRYMIKNSLGQQCYYAYEETDLCMRICCGPRRGFQFHIVDNLGNPVMRLTREFKCCAGCCWCADADCCGFEVEVESPPGNVIGKIRQRTSFWIPHFDIRNEASETMLKIKGPCCVCSGPCCTCDFPFEILSTSGDDTIGAITKQYSGFVKECVTKANNFSVTFPKDLDVKMKALMLGATFLIDMMFFEIKKDN